MNVFLLYTKGTHLYRIITFLKSIILNAKYLIYNVRMYGVYIYTYKIRVTYAPIFHYYYYYYIEKNKKKETRKIIKDSE